jgi:EmrB/QacA subfamily drug resistance transporter
MSETALQTTRSSSWLALWVLSAGSLMIILDQTIVNVALPFIAQDLGFSPTGLAWVVNAYLIAFGGLLLLAGRLGDLLGRKRIFLAGLAMFTAASLWCGLATSPTVLIAARFAQGAGGAVSASVTLGMLITLFPEPLDRAKAIGVYSFVGSGGASVGLLLGGVLTQALSWHWIFFVNVPIGLGVAFLGARVLTDDRGSGLRGGTDAAGAVLVTSALMLAVLTILKGGDFGWGSTRTVALAAVALALLGGFIAREATAENPLLPLGIFRSRIMSGGNLVLGLMLAGMFGQFFLGSLYLQRVLGYDPFSVGLAFLPVAVTIGGLSIGLSPRLNARFGARAVLIPSLVLITAGLGLLARVPVDGRYVSDVLPALLLLGTGGGLAFPALVGLAMSGATPATAGLASGLVNTTQQVGGALGLAVLATIAATRTDAAVADGAGNLAALTAGYNEGFGVAAIMVAVGAVVAAAVLRPERIDDASRDSAPARDLQVTPAG